MPTSTPGSKENGDRRSTLLILRALRIGDLLTAVPALRALSDAFQDHLLVLAAPSSLAQLAALTGAVDEVVDTKPLAPLCASLYDADVTVNLHGPGPQSHRVLLEARPRRLLSFANPEVPESVDGPQWQTEEHEVSRWCRLLEAYGIPADPDRLDLSLPPRPTLEPGCGTTLIHPGAASASRRWPADRWAAVAREELKSGRRVVVTGGKEVVDLARAVAGEAGLEDSAVYAGRTDLLDLATLVSVVDRVVCGDTGVAHLATALGTPSVVLFGPISPARWGPPPERPRHRVLWAGKTGDPHSDKPDPGLLECGCIT